MSFIKQHPKYESYTHDSYYLNKLPLFFKRDFDALIHSLLMDTDEEELTITAWSLQNRLAALVMASPSERGPFDYQMGEIRRVTRTIIDKGFPYVMDAIGLLLTFFNDEEKINSFLKEHKFGYTCSVFRGEVSWDLHEDIDFVNSTSVLDRLVHTGKTKHGFFATVTKYEDPDTGQKYALKRLKREFNDNTVYKKRFKREIEILSRLNGKHPNIINIIDYRFDENNNEYWYLMPYLPTNLYEFIKRYNNTLQLEERLQLFSQILDAMEFAHNQDILHRDLSAHNVLLDHNNNVLVSDFGLGKDFNHLTKQGYSSVQGYGSILYVAPEQQDNLKNATKKSDVYSLGKILYFILTGRDPRTTRDIDIFSSLINKATLEDPEGRYEDAAHLKSEFLKYKSYYKKVSTSPIRTVADLITKKKNFNWLEFHDVVLKAESYNHIYYDYLDPISSVLDSTEKIDSYLSVINSEIERVVELYIEKLHECYQTVGWPFNALNSFGYFLTRLYESTSDYPNCRLSLIKELWYIAAVMDQWAVQDIVVKLINQNRIPGSIELDFSMYILEEGRYFEKLNKIDLSRVSDFLKNAILELRKQSLEA